MPRHFLEIAFDGAAFHGWQHQPHDASVQAEVERAVATALHLPSIGVVGCGRTDSGVHARSFYLHFDADVTALDEGFVNSLNGILPDSIAVLRVLLVDDEAHARFSATARTYTYHVHGRKDPFLHGRSCLFRPAVDVARMNAACAVLIGRKDFAGFQKSGSDNRTTLCEVRRAVWEPVLGGCRFTITADRFLRNMVRAIVGSCLRVGQGRAGTDELEAILADGDRARAGKSAPACGLYLDSVEYPFIPK